MNKMLNIVLVEYINRNLGDTVIAESSKYLLEKALEYGNVKNYFIHEYNMYNEDMDFIKNADLIVFAGGGLVKYKREKIYFYVAQIVECAEKYNIPVFFNSVGVEGYDDSDIRCIELKRVLNYGCVKGITVRDDFETLKQKYLLEEKEWLFKTFDPAVFCSDLYGIEANLSSNVIGLGIVRDGLFRDYGYIEFTKQYQFEFWASIIEQLEACGYDWKIFGNGLCDDYEFSLELLEYMGLLEEKDRFFINRPTEGKELAKTISEFRAIIAPRLHANIIAFSVGVPSLGLVWNEKLKFFGQSIGFPERFIEPRDFEVGYIINELHKAISKGYDKHNVYDEKHRIVVALAEFIKKHMHNEYKNKISKEIDYQNCLVARALGGKLYKYSGMNSPITFYEKCMEGFVWFEVDLGLTRDDKVVCIESWQEPTCRKLGFKASDELPISIGYDEFFCSRYYDNHYPVMDCEMLFDKLSYVLYAKCIFDIRSNTETGTRKIISYVKERLEEVDFERRMLIIRVKDFEQLSIVLNADLRADIKIMFDITKDNSGLDGYIEKVNSDKNVEYISMNEETFYLCKNLISIGGDRKICVFSTNSLTSINRLLNDGVSLVATDYLSVNSLNTLR